MNRSDAKGKGYCKRAPDSHFTTTWKCFGNETEFWGEPLIYDGVLYMKQGLQGAKVISMLCTRKGQLKKHSTKIGLCLNHERTF
jgi:hypothetical protein